MARISKNQLSEEMLSKLFKLFFTVIGKRKDLNEFNEILSDLLSRVERVMIAKRIAIIYLLMKKLDYSIISETLKVSTATIAKFSLLMENSRGVVPILENEAEKDEMKTFLEELYLIFRGPGTYGVNWTDAWLRKRKLEMKKQTGF